MKQAILGYEQQFYINGTQMSGVQGVEGSYGVSEQPINVLGWGHVNNNFQPGFGSFEQDLTKQITLNLLVPQIQ